MLGVICIGFVPDIDFGGCYTKVRGLLFLLIVTMQREISLSLSNWAVDLGLIC